MADLKNTIRLLTRTIFPKKRVLRIVKLRKEASVRDYYRVLLSGNQSCIVMTLDRVPNPEALVEQIMEANVVFGSYRIPVPKIYRYFPEEALIIQKDAGSTSLEAYLVRYGYKKSLKYYKQIIDAMLRVRYGVVSEEVKKKIPFQVRFTREKFLEEFNFFIEHSRFLEGQPDVGMSFQHICEAVTDKLCQLPYTLTHRDLHSRNLQIQNGSYVLLDHQDARLGPAPYDLVSLVKDSYVALSHRHEVELVSYYMEQCKTVWERPVDFDAFFNGYYLCLFQRSIKAAGTFFYQVNVCNHMKYKKYIPRVMQYALQASRRIGLDDPTLRLLEQGVQDCLNAHDLGHE